MTKPEIVKLLKESGYWKTEGVRHETWTNGANIIRLHRGSRINSRIVAGIRSSLRKGWNSKSLHSR